MTAVGAAPRTLLGIPLAQYVRALAVALVAAVAAVLPASSPPADASSTYLCTSYSGCDRAGYSHAGYAGASGQMYWRMYSGHNCTNYVAYRMIKAGMSSERPWSGSGNASNWGHAMSRITDTTPAVGAVAWWDRNVPGAGSAGHVAYVEKVVSATEIIVSEDSWGGDFAWRRIVKSGTGWPTGFVHFIDQKKLQVARPTAIAGTPRVGEPLSLKVSKWKPGGTSRAVQWWVGDVAVKGATGFTYTPTPADLGKTVAVGELVTREGYVAGSSSARTTATVAEGALAPTSTPTLEGQPDAGQVLRATSATFSPAPEATTYGWMIDGQRRPKLDGPTLALTRGMVGKKVELVVVARRQGYGLYKQVRAAAGPVMAGAIAVTTPYAPAGTPRVGSTVSLAGGASAPADAEAAWTWLRDGVPIAGATSPEHAPTVDDVGHRLTAQVSLSKTWWRSAVQSHDFGVVTTPSRVGLGARGGQRTVTVKVRVAAPGHVPTGSVTVRVGARTTSAPLVDGEATLALTNVAPGERRAVVTYGGDGVATGGRAGTLVVVKPKR